MPILNMVGGGQKGGNIGEPLNLTVITSPLLEATITWEDNEIGTIPSTSFAKSELVRKVGSAPTSPSDGTLVVTETVKDTYKTTGYTDSGLTSGTTYYYRVFSYSDLGGISYCDAVNVTVGSRYQPTANTLLYLPLDSANTLNDLSGNGYNMTNNGNVSFGTYGGVDCAYFGTTAPYGLKNTSANIISGDYTFLVWINGDGSDSGTDFPRIFGGNNSWWLLWERRFELIHPVFLGTSAGVAYTSGWHLLAFTGNISTKNFTPYKDGVQLTGGTGNSTTSYSGILIGANESNNSEPVDRFCGYMSAVIWENRQRTATEISDYFDLTKSNYGIS